MKSKKWVIGVAILIIATLGTWLWWRSPSSKPIKKELVKKLAPSIGVTSMNITNIEKDKIKMMGKVSIKNPLPLDINAQGLKYKVIIDSIKVIEEDYSKPISIRSKDSTTIELPMELLAKPMKEVLEYFDKNKVDSADYAIKATFQADVPVAGQRDFTLDLSKRLPAIRLPKIKVEHVDLHALRLKKKGCDMQVRVTNPNLFPIKVKDAVFSLDIGKGDMQMNGKLQNIVDIPAKSSKEVAMHADFTKGKILKVGWEILTNKNNTPYAYKFNGIIMSDNVVLNKSAIAINMNGTIGELMAMVKAVK